MDKATATMMGKPTTDEQTLVKVVEPGMSADDGAEQALVLGARAILVPEVKQPDDKKVPTITEEPDDKKVPTGTSEV